MKIGLPTKTSGEKSFIDEHFGKCNFFYIYDTESEIGEVYINEFKDVESGACVKAVKLMLEKNVSVLIVPHVGKKALELLQDTDVELFKNTDKIVKDNIASFLNGELDRL